MIALVWLIAWSLAAPQVSIEETLARRLHDFLQAASHTPPSAADKRVFDEFFADDVVYTRASGVVIAKRDIMRSLDEPPRASDPTSTYTGEDVKVRRYGGIAIVTFRLAQKLSDGTTNRYRNTGVFLERNATWQVVAWQATRIAEP
jgi:Domain of unknown function (DUF4440)